MTPDADPAHRDADVLRHVYVDVAEQGEHRQRGSLTTYFGLAQIEIDITEHPARDRPALEVDPPALEHIAKQPDCEPCGATPRSGRRWFVTGGEADPQPLKVCLNSGRVSLVDPFRELLEREPPGQQLVPEPRHRLVALGIRQSSFGISHLADLRVRLKVICGFDGVWSRLGSPVSRHS